MRRRRRARRILDAVRAWFCADGDDVVPESPRWRWRRAWSETAALLINGSRRPSGILTFSRWGSASGEDVVS